MARDGWRSNISSFTVKNHLAQKCQPKSIWGSTSQMNWAFFCYFSIPTLRSYNTLEEIERGRHTLQNSQEVPCWEQQQFLNNQCLWHSKSKSPLQMQPQTQTSTCLMVTVENHYNQTGHWSSQRAISFQGEPWLY